MQINSDSQLHSPTVKSTLLKTLTGQTGHKYLSFINCEQLCIEFCVLHYAVYCVVTFVYYIVEYIVLWLLYATLYSTLCCDFCVLHYGVHYVVTFVCYIMEYTVSKHLLLSKPVCKVMSHIILLTLVLILHINNLLFP